MAPSGARRGVRLDSTAAVLHRGAHAADRAPVHSRSQPRLHRSPPRPSRRARCTDGELLEVDDEGLAKLDHNLGQRGPAVLVERHVLVLAAEDNDGHAIALAVGGGLEVALQVDRPADHAGGRRFLEEDSAEGRREELQGQGSLDADLEAHCTTASRTSTPTSPTTPETRAAGHGGPLVSRVRDSMTKSGDARED